MGRGKPATKTGGNGLKQMEMLAKRKPKAAPVAEESDSEDSDAAFGAGGFEGFEQDQDESEDGIDDDDGGDAFDLGVDVSSDEDENDDKDSKMSSDSEDDGEGSEEDEEDEEDKKVSTKKVKTSMKSKSESSDEESEDDDMDEEARTLKHLVDQLPANLRQKVLSGQKINVGSDDSDADSENSGYDSDSNDDIADKKSSKASALKGLVASSWGKRKNYYAADTADLEIGQDVQDALDEEEAAVELQQDRFKDMQEGDFYSDSDDDSASGSGVESEASDEGEDGEKIERLSGSMKRSKSGDNSRKAAQSVQAGWGMLGKRDSSGAKQMQVTEKMTVDRASVGVSKKKRLALLAHDAPELLALVGAARQREGTGMAAVLRDELQPLRAFLTSIDSCEEGNGWGGTYGVQQFNENGSDPSESDAEDSECGFNDPVIERESSLLEYIQLKEQLYLSFLTNLTFLMSLQASPEGGNVRNHPVMKTLLELQYALHKTEKLDKVFGEDLEAIGMVMQAYSLQFPAAVSSSKSPSRRKSKGAEAESSVEDKRDWLIEQLHELREAMAEDSDEGGSESDEESDEVEEEQQPGQQPGSADEEDSDDSMGESEEDMERQMLEEEQAFNSIDGGKRKKGRRVQSDSDSDSSDDEGDDIADEDADALADEGLDRRAIRKAQRQQLKKTLESFSGAASKEKRSKGMPGVDDALPTAGTKAEKRVNVKEAMQQQRDDDDENADVNADANGGEGDGGADITMMPGYDAKAFDKLKNALTGMYGGTKDLPTSKPASSRRPAPSDSMGGDIGGGGDDADSDADAGGDSALYEEFASRKKQYKQAKKDHYQPDSRFGGMFDMSVQDVKSAKGSKKRKQAAAAAGTAQEAANTDAATKRAATYEIMKNKGLTPHRKKANRNPRVKKKLQFNKALVARRGQIRDVNTSGVQTGTGYAGEQTGIKANLSRSRKIAT